MKKLFPLAFVLILLALTACEPVDPYTALNSSDGTIVALQVTREQSRLAITATAAAAEMQAVSNLQMATQHAEDLRAAADERAFNGTATADQANRITTATAQSIAATATAGVLGMQLQATREAWDRQSTIDVASVRALATSQASLAKDVELGTRRKELTNNLLAYTPYVILAIAIAAVLAAGALFSRAFVDRMHTFKRDTLIERKGTIYDPARSFEPAVKIGKNGAIPQPVTTPALQAQVTMRDQAIAAIAAANNGNGRKSALQAFAPVAQPEPQISVLPEVAPWAKMANWPGGKFVIGEGENHQPVELDPGGVSPHLLMAGTTGSGKTSGGLRPIAAEALASGWQVIVLDRGTPDFTAFADHPNATVIVVDNSNEAIDYLRLAHAEMRERMKLLASAGQHDWSAWPDRPRPFVLLVVDEFSNLADELEPGDRADLWRWARVLAAEGRKAGMLLALALQDPSYKSMDLRIRRNCTAISFQVRDGAASRLILNADGAEALKPGQFLVRSGNLVRGVAFKPSDDEIRAFLQQRPAAQLPAPDWLARSLDDEPVDVIGSSTMATDVARLAEKIRPGWENGQSKRAMAKLAGGEYAGAFAHKIDQAIAFLATTTPHSGPQGAQA